MNKKEIKKTGKRLCNILLVMSNIGMIMCCILVYKGILQRSTQIVCFSIQMFVFFIIGLHLGNYFKNLFSDY